MTDPRAGLQRRYDLQTILELHKGKPKLEGLNYDALRILKDPLYVKMGQELKDESQGQHNRILLEEMRMNDLRRFASQNDLPRDFMDGFDNGGDDDMGRPPPPPPGGRGPPPDFDEDVDGDASMDPPVASPPAGYRQRPMTESATMTDFPPPPPPAPDSAMAPNSTLFRSNVEIQAELAALRQEMQKKDKHETVIREVRQGISQPNPIKEVVREFHQVIHPPQLIQTPVPYDNPALIAALEQAMMRNTNLEKIASQMGLSLEQIAQILSQKDKKPPEMVSASSSSGQPPPPPPPPPARVQRSRSRSVVPPAEIAVPPTPPAISRQPSIASTTDYRSRSGPRGGQGPTPIPINTPRQPSAATTADYRSQSKGSAATVKRNDSVPPRPPSKPERSRSRNQEIILPIQEEEQPAAERGRARNNKIMEQMLDAQNNKLIKGAMRVHLGKFARSFQKQTQPKKEEPSRTASEPPKKQTRSFEEIEELSLRDVPFGASLQKQRVNSVGDERRRYQGRLIR